MQPQITETVEHDTDEVRRTVHNVAAAIISVRALAETLAEHVPTLVAISRSRNIATQAHIPPETLDAIPAIPGEIVKLCEIAREALQAVGSESRVTNSVSVRAISGGSAERNLFARQLEFPCRQQQRGADPVSRRRRENAICFDAQA